MAAASTARIEANRANAQLSTGPRSEQGKLASSKNATRSGLTAAAIFVRPGEELEFAEFQSALNAEIKPKGITQSGLFNIILHAAWNIRRCFQLESEIQIEAIAAGIADALLDDVLAKKLDRIYRYKKMHESSHRRATADLRKLQTEELWRTESQLVVDESILIDSSQVVAKLRPVDAAKRRAADANVLLQMPPLTSNYDRAGALARVAACE